MNRFFIFCLSILLLFSGSYTYAQEKYWIYFNSKTGNDGIPPEDSIKAHRDLPVFNGYIDQLSQVEVVPEVNSKWLNAISARLEPDQLQKVREFPFVIKIEPTRQIASTHSSRSRENKKLLEEYTTALKQVKADKFIEKGLTGEGVDVGIIDGGFLDANVEETLDDIFYEDQFKAYKDFTNSAPEPFEGRQMYDDDHGTRVWRNIGGYEREKERYHGIATYSNYYLAKSDRGDREFRGEEDYWIAAIEWMDSLGVRIINSSLGYSTGFDDPTENYDPLQIDGQSSPITKAAQIAAEEKGMFIVVSAGNDGNEEFQYVSVPADAKDVFTVGACTTGNSKKISYSSLGSPLTDYVKPDVSVFALGGTSFSAPIVTGMAAAMMQYQPGLTNFQLMDIIRKSSHLYPYANNYIGFGVPDSEKIIALLDDPERKVWDSEEIEVVGDLHAVPSGDHRKMTVFHKKNEFLVLLEEEVKDEGGEFIIARPAGTVRSTYSKDGRVYEIFWQ